MNKNFLLIVPPNITYENFINPGQNSKTWKHNSGGNYGVLITDVPLGVLTISAVLKQNAWNVQVIDFNVEVHKTWQPGKTPNFRAWFSNVLGDLRNSGFQPDMIGFSSLFTSGYKNLLDLAVISRDVFGDVFKICGGNVATTMYREIFNDAPDVFDALCFGEGEIALAKLINSDDFKSHCDESNSWITKSNLFADEVTIYKHNFIDDLDEIPYLDYSAVDLLDYHFNPTIKAYTGITDKTNYFTFMGSRGCPFLCTFCSAHAVHGRKMRSFSIPRIEKELTSLKEQFGSSTLVIEDDMFLWNSQWAIAVLKIAQKLGLNCFFPNALALYALDRPMLEELHRTGVRQLTLAVESGSGRVLKELMKKPLKLSITKRVANDCRDLGIYTDCNIILGMPGETKEDISDTREFLKTLGANWYRINVAMPLAGSEMYITAQKNGFITGDIRNAGYKQCVINTPTLRAAEVEEIAYELNLELNFLNNTDLILEQYESAIKVFKNVLSVRSDHALAMYMISLIYFKTGDLHNSKVFKEWALSHISKSEFWLKYFGQKALLFRDGSELFFDFETHKTQQLAIRSEMRC